MDKEIFFPIVSQAGVKRDGTLFNSPYWLNSSWTRFYDDRPLKIGGYKTVQNGTSELIRDIFIYNVPTGIQLYMGRPSSLSYCIIDKDNNSTAIVYRTPTSDFFPSASNTWTFDTVTYYTVPDDPYSGETVYLIATVAPNIESPINPNFGISNTIQSAVFYGDITDQIPLNPLIPLTNPVTTIPLTTAGGVMVLGDYVLLYNVNGLIIYNDGMSITKWPTDNFLSISTSKIVYGAPVRSNNVISGLVWSLDAVLLLTFNPTLVQFEAAYISTFSSILSSRCVISFDPYFFWIGEDTFYQYNGIVQELENTMNKKWFFDNLNKDYKQKVTGFIDRKYGELWWLFPKGTSEENNWAIVYNINGKFWFDTDNMDRSCAQPTGSSYGYPIMCSSKPVPYGNTSLYPVWAHELGLDKVQFGQQPSAIVSYVESALVNVWKQQPQGITLMVTAVIPDAVQETNLLLTINKRGYPQSDFESSQIYVIEPSTEFLTCNEKGSFLSFQFLNNSLGGDFFLGQPMAKIKITDGQRPGPVSSS